MIFFRNDTAAIPWDADESHFKEALEKLANVKIFEVRRCDRGGVASGSASSGGFDGWVYGCPFVDRGGYSWLIVFDVLISQQSLPTLFAHRTDLTMDTWSGNGAQILVSRVPAAFMHPHDCLQGRCSLQVPELSPGTLYSFRYRALITTAGWTAYSKPSPFQMTKDDRPPSRYYYRSVSDPSFAFTLA